MDLRPRAPRIPCSRVTSGRWGRALALLVALSAPLLTAIEPAVAAPVRWDASALPPVRPADVPRVNRALAAAAACIRETHEDPAHCEALAAATKDRVHEPERRKVQSDDGTVEVYVRASGETVPVSMPHMLSNPTEVLRADGRWTWLSEMHRNLHRILWVEELGLYIGYVSWYGESGSVVLLLPGQHDFVKVLDHPTLSPDGRRLIGAFVSAYEFESVRTTVLALDRPDTPEVGFDSIELAPEDDGPSPFQSVRRVVFQESTLARIDLEDEEGRGHAVWMDLGGEDEGAWVGGTQVHLREGPSTDAPILATLPWGTRVRPISADGDWERVVIQGHAGWVSAPLLQASKPPRSALPAGIDPDRFCAGREVLADRAVYKRLAESGLDRDWFPSLPGSEGACTGLRPADPGFGGLNPLGALERADAPGLNVRLAALSLALAPDNAYRAHPAMLAHSPLLRPFEGLQGANRQPVVAGEEGSKALAELFGSEASSLPGEPPDGVFLFLARIEEESLHLIASEGLGVPGGRFPATELELSTDLRQISFGGNFPAAVLDPCGGVWDQGLWVRYDASTGELSAKLDSYVRPRLLQSLDTCGAAWDGALVLLLDRSEDRAAHQALMAVKESEAQRRALTPWGSMTEGVELRWSAGDKGDVVLRRATYGPCGSSHHASLQYDDGTARLVDVLDRRPGVGGEDGRCP